MVTFLDNIKLIKFEISLHQKDTRPSLMLRRHICCTNNTNSSSSNNINYTCVNNNNNLLASQLTHIIRPKC